MTYQRKTEDTWELWTNYGYGWEHETTDYSRKEHRETIKAYRENTTAQIRTRRRRVKIDSTK